MNQILGASIALILTLILWGFGQKPSKKLYKGSTKLFPHGSNQQTINLVKNYSKGKTQVIKNADKLLLEIPHSKREKLNLRKKLFKLICSGPEERLLAVKIASNWNDASLLPILRRGLKDFDSRVIIAAAKGINKHRTISMKTNSQLKKRPPRNIFLMR